MMLYLLLIPLFAGLLAFGCIGVLYLLILREDEGPETMRELGGYIREGAWAFLKREMKTIIYFIVIIGGILLAVFWPKWQISFGFILGSLFSFLAVIIGMDGATRTNVRTASALRSSGVKALVIAFRGGAIMGLAIVSLQLLGLVLLYVLFGVGPSNPDRVSLLVGFGFGASLSALFAQLGGGIYTKAADVGADLTGKIEIGIPEDDPRNPAVIADLVGDNVGDCAGRGADLFESGSDNLIAAMIVGLLFIPLYGWKSVLFPLIICSIGNLATVIGLLSVRGWKGRKPIISLNIALLTAGITSIVGFYLTAIYLMGDIRFFWCLSLGLLAAVATFFIVQYYTGEKPIRDVAKGNVSGAAIGLMQGFAYGMESATIPIFIIAATLIAAYLIFGGGLRGLMGIIASALGLMEIMGMVMATDTYGPIVDNAGGIIEMAGLSKDVEREADALDAAGNVTKAITKGYSMAAATLTCSILLFAYLTEAARHSGISLLNISQVSEFLNIADPRIITALMVGAAIPFLFTALTVKPVAKGAHQVVDEVRRQFREIKGIMEGKAKPDYAACVDITTRNALREMILPTMVGMISPIIVGFLLGPWCLAAFLVSTTIVGALLAIFMFNSGAIYDNAKKYIEDGHFGGKNTPAHHSAVIGDTFGDPLKDTAGPSLHILIKLVNIVSITLLPLFLTHAILV